MEKQQLMNSQVVQILDDRINGYQQKYDDLDAAIVSLQMSPVSVGPSQNQLDTLETQFKALESAMLNIQQVLSETVNRIDMAGNVRADQSPVRVRSLNLVRKVNKS